MQWELDFLHWFQSIHTPVMDVIMAFLSLFSEAGIGWILLALILIFIPKYRKAGWAIGIALVFSVIFCNGIMKPLVHRIRPYDVDTTLRTVIDGIKFLPYQHDYSFPSGHTSASFAAAVALICFKDKRKEGIAAVILAALIAISRLYLSMHYPTDVLVSMILGSVYGVCGYIIVRIVINKTKLKPLLLGKVGYIEFFKGKGKKAKKEE